MSWLLIVILVLLGFADTALAVEGDDVEDGLSKVVFHTEHIDEEAARVLRAGVAAAWAVSRLSARQHGLSEFPRSHFWGFYEVDDAARASGETRREWAGIGGKARGNRAWVLLDRDRPSPGVAAHEAIHVLQSAISGSNLGSQCIAEGAADWYELKALDHLGIADFDQGMGHIRQAPYDEFDLPGFEGTAVTEEQLRESGLSEEQIARYNERLREASLPALLEMTSGRAFREAFREFGSRVYRLCTAAFDLLIRIEGGEAAYFEYMETVRSVGWRTGFDRAFTEDLETFLVRFARYRETRGEDYRLPKEIERDAFLDEYVRNCRLVSWRFLNLCID